jgi:phage shock protein C
MQTKLYRSKTDSMIAGVCGGLGRYLGIDPTLVRLFFVLLALGSGVGVFVYLLLWILVPREGVETTDVNQTVRDGANEMAERARTMGEDLRRGFSGSDMRSGAIIGAALILMGVFFLMRTLDIAWLRWLDFDLLWPALLVVAGVVLLWRRARGG